jgi:iron-sulfur cluster insertion protein
MSASLITITENAARHLNFLRSQEKSNVRLRIIVSSGGCAGFQYSFSFDEAFNKDDHVFDRDGAKIILDNTSLSLLNGSEVDYIEEMISSSFVIRNPNSAYSCGCGSSFSI